MVLFAIFFLGRSSRTLRSRRCVLRRLLSGVGRRMGATTFNIRGKHLVLLWSESAETSRTNTNAWRSSRAAGRMILTTNFWRCTRATTCRRGVARHGSVHTRRRSALGRNVHVRWSNHLAVDIALLVIGAEQLTKIVRTPVEEQNHAE